MTCLETPALAVDHRVRARIAAGDPVLQLTRGEAGPPFLPETAELLAGAAHLKGYGPVAGSIPARSALAGYCSRFTRRGRWEAT
ncbi:MAG: hypothetical protein ACRENX_05860 [Candidatus Dormibacteria bacterium]